MKKKAPPQITARVPRISQSPRFICARIIVRRMRRGSGAAASALLALKRLGGSIGFMAGRK